MVTDPVFVAIAGTHATGKSTLARRVEMELRAVGYRVARIGGQARAAAAIGWPKMTRHTTSSTEWIMTAGAAAALHAGLDADVVILDRTPVDALAYWLAALEHRGENPDPGDEARLTALALALMHRNRLLLATILDPDLPFAPPAGKDRDYADRGYRAAIDAHLHRALAATGLPHTPVASGDPAAAVALAVRVATEHLAAA